MSCGVDALFFGRTPAEQPTSPEALKHLHVTLDAMANEADGKGDSFHKGMMYAVQHTRIAARRLTTHTEPTK